MQLIESSPHLRMRHRVTYVLFTLLFMVAPFYYQDNLGGEGLSLPFNAVIWVPAVMLIGLGLSALLATGYWVKSRFLWFIVLFPVLITIGGFASGLERPGEWLIRLGALIGGIMLWFSLLQMRLKRRDVDGLLYILLAGLLLHAVIGLTQLFPAPFLVGWIPVANGQLLGMFQQPNLQATMMSTAVALSLFLAASPGFRHQRWPMRSLVFLALGLAVFEIVASGSRVGILSLGLVILLVFGTNTRRWRQRPLFTLGLCVIIGAGGVAGVFKGDGALKAYNKLERLTEQGQDPRPHIYSIALDAWQRSPVIGHGIGSFQREFQNQRIEYYDPSRGEVIDNARFSHPHNELLYWAVEGGVVALAAIGLAVLAVILQLYRLGLQRGGLTAALLLPIVLHTQVELPFYISTLHWLVLVVLLFVCFYPGAKVKQVDLSIGASKLLLASGVVIPSVVSVFLMSSLLSQTGIMQYMKSRGAEPQHLNFALNNLYFREQGEYFLMRSLLLSGLSSDNREAIQSFIDWSAQFLEQIPDVQILQDQAVAYQYLGRFDEAKSTIGHATSMYPANEMLGETAKRINAGEVPTAPSHLSQSNID